MKRYFPSEIEKKWQDKWQKDGIYRDYSRENKFYALDMFPYPSGAGLHVGHPKGYIATDVSARYKMLNGFSVLHPMGWDAFGLPAENYAIEHKVHPRVAVEKNIATFKKQLEMFGFTYDWEREINTTDPDYYRWTQWIFLQMFNKGLAYESEEPVNWCPKDKTVLALEDLEDGKCERCGSEVIQKKLRQWVLKMTDYADRLLYDLDSEGLDWEEAIIEQQKNWIGRSEGADVDFLLEESGEKITVFTTRIDTIFSGTYIILAPEHPLVEKITTADQKKSVTDYVEQTAKKTEMERTGSKQSKTGVFTGAYAINPATNEKIPVWISDFVLANYGTGVVFADAHDQRDFDMAKKYGIPLKVSIRPQDDNLWEKVKNLEECFEEEGVLVNSEQFDGLSSIDAKPKIIEWLSKKGLARKKVNYKMRDWVFSRQRYWGEPIPVVHCEKCGTVGVPEDQLPVRLPEVEKYEPTGTGEGPLAGIFEWVNTTCPKCGGPAKRETNTMPQWAGSSWYYLRYIDPKNNSSLVDKTKEKEWMPVDLYVGGAEHATRHLLYARFWHKFLFDIGVVSTKEPFKKLVHVGLINGEDGRKMSKRFGNVVNPDSVIKEYGADALRVFEMFMGPFMQNIAWSTAGTIGSYKFLEKVWKLEEKVVADSSTTTKIKIALNKTIKKVTEDIENFKFNTAISALMVMANKFEAEKTINKEDYINFLILLAPFAPHITEEIYHLDNESAKSIHLENWPSYQAKYLVDEMASIVVQVNGKMRDTILVKRDEVGEQKFIEEVAKHAPKVSKYIEGQQIRKVIYVEGKLINFVV